MYTAAVVQFSNVITDIIYEQINIAFIWCCCLITYRKMESRKGKQNGKGLKNETREIKQLEIS